MNQIYLTNFFKKNGRPPAPLIAWVVLIVTLFFLYITLIPIFFKAFYVTSEEGKIQIGFYWFEQLLVNSDWMSSLLNSVYVGVSCGILSTILGFFMAISLFQKKNKITHFLNFCSHLSLLVPEIAFAIALLIFFVLIQLPLSLLTVLIAHVSFCIAYSGTSILGGLEKLDLDLVAAASDLGATKFQTYWKVILPNLKPSLISSFVLAFILSFDDFLISFFVNGVGSNTLPVSLYASMRMGLDGRLNALAFLLFVTSSTLLYFVHSRRSEG